MLVFIFFGVAFLALLALSELAHILYTHYTVGEKIRGKESEEFKRWKRENKR